MHIRLPLLLLIVLLGVACGPPASAQDNLDTSNVNRWIYVATDGSDANNGNWDSELRTLKKAVDVAINGPLAAGVKTCIYVRDGTYRNQPTAGWYDDHRAGPRAYPGKSRQTLLLIHGQTRGGVVWEGSSDYRQLVFHDKNNLLLKNMTFRGVTRTEYPFFGAVHLEADFDRQGNGRVGPDRSRNLRIENCDWTGNRRIPLVVFGYDDVSIRDCTSSGNQNSLGMTLERLEDAVVDRVRVNDNSTGSWADYGNAGIWFSGRNVVLRNIEASRNLDGAGFRMDFLSENVTLSDSTFNNNGYIGLNFETAYGPTRLLRVTANGNGGAGLKLATVYGFTVDGCTFRGNQVGVEFHDMDRSVVGSGAMFRAQNADMADQASVNNAAGRSMMWNRSVTIKNTTIIGTSPTQRIYQSYYDRDGTWAREYGNFVRLRYSGFNNTFENRSNPGVFNTWTGTNNRIWDGFNGWKAATNSDLNSRFIGG